MDKIHENGVVTFTAGGTVAKGNPVKFSSGKVIATTAATDLPIGIALDDAASDEIVPVKVLGTGGTTMLLAGGAITQGAQIAANATATAADTDIIIGVALAAASSGELVEIATQCGQTK